MSVICIGELLIDFICTDKDIKLVDGTNFIKTPGGAPANVAVAVKKMGVQSCFMGSVGNDPFGAFLENTLKKFNVNCDMLVKKDSLATTCAFVSLKANGERDFCFSRGADACFSAEDVRHDEISSSKVFHFGSATAFLGGNLLDTYYGLLDYCIKNEKIVSFDPNYRADLYKNGFDDFKKHCAYFIKHTDILKVSEEEAFIITGIKDTESAAKALCDMGAKFTIITLGAKGALLADGERVNLIESEPVKMVDATGAGDAFIGAVIAEIAQKCQNPGEIKFDDMRRFVKRANMVGAMTVQKYGALESIPTIAEIKNLEAIEHNVNPGLNIKELFYGNNKG